MKNFNASILLSVIVLMTGTVNAQSVKVGGVTTAVTATGTSLSIPNVGAMQVNNISPVAQGNISAAQQIKSSVGAADTSSINAENLNQLDIAKNSFENQRIQAEISSNQKATYTGGGNSQSSSKGAQDRRANAGKNIIAIQANKVTDNIGFYNKTSINQIEASARESKSEKYLQFPEYIIKNY